MRKDRKGRGIMKSYRVRKMSQTIAAFVLSTLVATVGNAQQATMDPGLTKARSALRSAKYHEVLRELNDTLTKNPTNADAWCLKGEAQTRMKDISGSLESFDRAIQADKTSIYAVVGKANTLAQSNKENEAQTLLRKAIAMTPKTPYDFLARGAAFRGLGQYEQALRDYDETLKLTPGLPEAQMNKGMVYWHKGDYAGAIRLFSEAIKLDPAFVEALTNRGAAFRKRGDNESAIADYSKAIEINPNDAMTFYNRGVAYQKKEHHEKAISDFTSAIRLQTRYPEAYLNRGVAYMTLNKTLEARKDFEKAAEQDPSGEAGQKARKGLEILKSR
jgi:tetratricopeptide (TPR) repeat protein